MVISVEQDDEGNVTLVSSPVESVRVMVAGDLAVERQTAERWRGVYLAWVAVQGEIRDALEREAMH